MRRSFAVCSLLALLAGPLCAGAQSVAPGAQVVTGSRLVGVARKAVHGMLSDTDREINVAYSLPDQIVPAGTVAIDAQTAQITPTYVAVPLAIEVDGKTVRTVMAGFRITTFIHTAVAARDLSFGTVLSESDVTVGRVPSTGRQPVDAASLIGRQLNVAILHGSAMFVEQTRINELVKAGMPVVFIIRDGGFVLTADVVARQSGGMGAIVAVYNPQTRKELSGVVTGPAQVELALPSPEVLQ